MYDIIIKNGKIIDGTGSPYFRADIAVKDGKIVKIARGLEGAKETIDAAGLCVTPGFIDSHSHSDRTILNYPDQQEKIEQGITTSIAGQCGSSVAPCHRDTPDKGINATMGEFLDAVRDTPQGSNTATFVGHGSIRSAVMGTENRAPTEDELKKMKALLRDAMEHGALGMSYGLIYNPGIFSETPELCEMAKALAEYNGVLSIHMRNEGYELIKATEEFISVIKASGVRGVISHHKAVYEENWGKVNHTLAMIDKVNDEGYDLYCDVYPYTASHTNLPAYFIPKEYRANEGTCRNLMNAETREIIKKINIEKYGNDLSWVFIVSCKNHPEVCGKFIPEIAKMLGVDDHEAVFRLITDSDNSCNGCFFTMCEADVETVMRHPRAMICTDSAVARDSTVFHPRVKATFPRVLGEYVRNRKVTTLPEMIRKMTSMPAAVYGLSGKGILREGMDADICIFDSEKIIDKATFANCNVRCEGLNYVILSGRIVVKDAVYTGEMAGSIILRQ